MTKVQVSWLGVGLSGVGLSGVCVCELAPCVYVSLDLGDWRVARDRLIVIINFNFISFAVENDQYLSFGDGLNRAHLFIFGLGRLPLQIWHIRLFKVI